MKVWEKNYNGNTIRIENRWSGEKLIVNGEVQDECIGIASRSRLWGKLPTGETIKVSLGCVFTVNCVVFIDNKLLIKC
ncbi:hypothetical protein [Clostridium gasigenes]|uniref:Uncharacterized protein n=1 Tax=Clostridium gasigenes TaxID=94869 RepID=A0A1H0PRP7_9CLOT|nr:hypothetical protein [Clostridium gasigenes]MBU3088237.1 hypothetical protein [Clostridium gasigenes]SDP07792.1 hypothetical protein SAMN04488529_10249 [Clostridium gasigenes]